MAEDQGDPRAQRARARVGAVLRGKWRLDALLGIGGMAAVYAATHRNGKRGAVKVLHPEISTDQAARRRFLHEGYAANAVGHQGAVAVLDDDDAEDGAVFLVMELLEGHTVAARAESCPGSKLTPGEVLAIADQLLDVLGAAHDKRIVHRDLKPENLFLTTTGQVKVLDFGLARLCDLTSMPGAQRMTATGTLMGTPAFMPPEQALGNWDQVDARTDLWAVGATMFTLLTGRAVHEADSISQLLLAAMTKPAPPIATIEPDLPPAVAAIVDRALAFEQKDRWPDAGAMREAVRRARGQVGESAAFASTLLSVGPVHRSPESASIGPTTSEPRIALGKRGAVAGGLALGALACALAVFAMRGPQAARRPASTGLHAAPSAGALAAKDPRHDPSACPTSPGPQAPADPPPSVAPSGTASSSARARPEGPNAPQARPPTPSATAKPRASAAAPRAPGDDPFKKW